MKNSKCLLVFFALCGLLLISANAPSSMESEISQFIDLFVKKWNQHDPKALDALWAENGDLMNPAGEWEKGKNNVLKILMREQGGVLRKSQMKQEVTNILILSPTMAWVDANVKLTIPGVPEGLDHHIVYLLVKQNNEWRILAARPYQFLELHLELSESPHAYNNAANQAVL